MLYSNSVDAENIAHVIAICSSVTYCLYWSQKINQFSLKVLIEHFKTLLSIILMLMLFTPLLNTLTKSLKLGTLKVLSWVFVFIHVWAYDYTAWKLPKRDLTKNGRFLLSLNWIFFTAVLLTSQLKDYFKIFMFLSTTTVVFGYAPHIRVNNKYLAVSYVAVNAYFLSYIHPVAVFAFWSLIWFIWLLCPLLLIYLHSYKNYIEGPWDIAVVNQVTL